MKKRDKIMEKILIGCITYDGQKHCLESFLKALSETGKRDVIFVDNSMKDDYSELLRSKGFKVIRDKPKEENRIDRIISGRNIIREYFLKSDYDYLFFLDTDVLIPKDTFQQLLKCETDIATGVYLCNQDIRNKRMIAPVIYKIRGPDTVQVATIKEMIPERIFEIAVCGLGSALIKRKVLEKVPFRQFTDLNEVQDDVAFCVDSRKAGFKIKVNTAVKCDHVVKLFGGYRTLRIDLEGIKNIQEGD